MVKEDSAEFLGIVLWVYISQSFLIPKLYSTQDTEIVKKIKACMDPIENKLSVFTSAGMLKVAILLGGKVESKWRRQND